MSQPYIFMGANAEVGRIIATFKEFPPGQRQATFGIDQALETLQKVIGN